MSNIIAGGLAVFMAVLYLGYYAYRLGAPVLYIIIGINLCALLFDYYSSITKGEDLI